MKYRVLCSIVMGAIVAFGFVPVTVKADGTYGSGGYGMCQYASCSISLSSSGSVAADITPNSPVTCTVRSDSVTVTTDSSTGYKLLLNDTDTAATLAGAKGGAIAATSGTSTTPSTLGANTWGYRVDSTAGFGSGPTSNVTNASAPTLGFAAIPVSTDTPATLASSTTAANPAVTTTVWYGVCSSTSLPADAYSDSVTYTALIN